MSILWFVFQHPDIITQGCGVSVFFISEAVCMGYWSKHPNVKTSQCQKVPMSKRPKSKRPKVITSRVKTSQSQNVPSQIIPESKCSKSKRPKFMTNLIKSYGLQTNGSIYDWFVGFCCLMTPHLSKDIKCHV